MRGGRRRGREKKKREDNIREWTGLEFANSQRVVGNREKDGERTEEEMERHHQGVDRAGVRQLPDGCGELTGTDGESWWQSRQ